MTVKHLQTLQRQQMAAAVSSDPTVLNKFKGGFSECATEISRYLNTIDGVDKNVRARLLTHLATCLGGLHNYLTPLAFPSIQPGFPAMPAQFFPNTSSPHLHSHNLLQKEGAHRNVPAGLIMLPSRDHFPVHSLRGGSAQHFFPQSVSPLNCLPLSEHNSCSSPSHSAPSTPSTPHSMTSSFSPSTPSTPLSPASSMCSSKMGDLSDPVWRPWWFFYSFVYFWHRVFCFHSRCALPKIFPYSGIIIQWYSLVWKLSPRAICTFFFKMSSKTAINDKFVSALTFFY